MFQHEKTHVNKILYRIYHKYKTKGFTVQCGRNRLVLIGTNYVIKLPLNRNGICDNDWEGHISNDVEQTEYDIQYAKTHMCYIHNIPIVFMEYVKPANFQTVKKRLGMLPEWVYSVDCGQVGFNQKGKLLAFDYGL